MDARYRWKNADCRYPRTVTGWYTTGMARRRRLELPDEVRAYFAAASARRAVYPHPCVQCGGAFMGIAQVRYCSRRCRVRARPELQRRLVPLQARLGRLLWRGQARPGPQSRGALPRTGQVVAGVVDLRRVGRRRVDGRAERLRWGS